MFASSVVEDRAEVTIDLDATFAAEHEADYAASDDCGDGGFRSIVDDDPREAIADLDAAVGRLSRSTPDALGDRLLLDAYAQLEHTRRRLDAEQARMLEDISRRQAYVEEACTGVGGWLKHRLNRRRLRA